MRRTAEKYHEAYARITGEPLSEWLGRTGAGEIGASGADARA